MNLRCPTTHTKLGPFQHHPRRPQETAVKSSLGLNIHKVNGTVLYPEPVS